MDVKWVGVRDYGQVLDAYDTHGRGRAVIVMFHEE